MDAVAPRTSLWSRLVVFYSFNKPNQLNVKVIREIIAKYGLKERELAARLLSKYGRPLPRSVSNQELRKVLADFGMQDEDPATQRAEHAPATSAAKSTLSTPSTSSVGGAKGLDSSGEAAAAAARGRSCAAGPGRSESADWAGTGRDPPQQGQREGTEQIIHVAGSLDFRSPFFDALKALRDDKLKPPFPKQAALDNVFKFSRLLPKSHVFEKQSQSSALPPPPQQQQQLPPSPAPPPSGTFAFPAVASGHGSSNADPPSSRVSTGKPERGGDAKRPQPPHAGGGTISSATELATELSKSVGGVTAGGGKRVTSGPDVGPGTLEEMALVGHYGPGARGIIATTDDIGKVDALKALGRHQRVIERRARTGGRTLGSNLAPVTRIMEEYAGAGPYSLLHRLHVEKRRACVMIRRVNGIRGVCTGLIRGFDRHMNILLADVSEDYTTSIPAHPPEPPSPPQPYSTRPQQMPETGSSGASAGKLDLPTGKGARAGIAMFPGGTGNMVVVQEERADALVTSRARIGGCPEGGEEEARGTGDVQMGLVDGVGSCIGYAKVAVRKDETGASEQDTVGRADGPESVRGVKTRNGESGRDAKLTTGESATFEGGEKGHRSKTTNRSKSDDDRGRNIKRADRNNNDAVTGRNDTGRSERADRNNNDAVTGRNDTGRSERVDRNRGSAFSENRRTTSRDRVSDAGRSERVDRCRGSDADENRRKTSRDRASDASRRERGDGDSGNGASENRRKASRDRGSGAGRSERVDKDNGSDAGENRRKSSRDRTSDNTVVGKYTDASENPGGESEWLEKAAAAVGNRGRGEHHAPASSCDSTKGLNQTSSGPGKENSVEGEGAVCGKAEGRNSCDDRDSQRRKTKSRGRRSRHKGPWRGDLVEIRRQRFLKQLLIRGDNVVMIWEAPRR